MPTDSTTSTDTRSPSATSTRRGTAPTTYWLGRPSHRYTDVLGGPSPHPGPAGGAEPADEAFEAFDNGALSRFNAWFFTAFAGYINHVARPLKARAFAGLAADTVVEIGAGTGANLRYLSAGTHLIAVEPNLAMHDRLRSRCAAAGVDVTIVPGGAERIPLPDASVDEVICSLVLCTVGDPQRAVDEVRRVLRPGGRFRFVEHVAAPRRGVRRAIQRAIRRPWSWVFEGCHTDRHTLDVVRDSGFSEVRVERRRFRQSFFFPVNSAAWGVATR